MLGNNMISLVMNAVQVSVKTTEESETVAIIFPYTQCV